MAGSTGHKKQELFLAAFFMIATVCAATEDRESLKRRIDRFKKNSEWVEPKQYIINVTSQFSKRLQEYGVGNLPIPDKVYNVNATRYNIPLLGSLEFTDGYVANIGNVSYHTRDFIWFLDDEGAVVHFKVHLINVTVFYNLRAQLDNSDSKARAVLTFPSSYIQVVVNLDAMTHRARVKVMSTTSVSGPKSTLTPDSSVMKAIGYNMRLTMAKSLFTDLKIWIENSMQSLMETVVRELRFPLHTRRPKRRPGLRALGSRRRRIKPDRRSQEVTPRLGLEERS